MRTTRPPSCSLAAASLTAVASTTHRPLRLLPTPVGGPRHRCTLAYRCAHMHITYAYVWSASAHALHSSALPIVHTCLIVHTAHTITCRHAYAYTYMPKTTRHAYVALVAYGARGVGRTCGDQHLPLYLSSTYMPMPMAGLVEISTSPGYANPNPNPNPNPKDLWRSAPPPDMHIHTCLWQDLWRSAPPPDMQGPPPRSAHAGYRTYTHTKSPSTPWRR